MFPLLGLCCKKLMYILAPPLTSSVPQSYLRCCVLGLRPQFCPLNKTLLNFQLVHFFQSAVQTAERAGFPFVVVPELCPGRAPTLSPLS